MQNGLAEILGSEAYHQQSVAMIRRECPGCTCGVESSLAMKHSASGAFFELSRLLQKPKHIDQAAVTATPQPTIAPRA